MDIHVPSMDIEPNTPLDAEQRDRSAGPDSEERLPPKKWRTSSSTIAWNGSCSCVSKKQWLHATVKRFYLLNYLST